MKYVLIIGDGMADEPVKELGGKTPLQYAITPMMDSLASAGELGLVRTIPEGMPAGSDTAILSIFGCDPRSCYTGRAPLEAASTGILLSPGDVAYRCNMVSFEESDIPFTERKIVSHSAGSIDGELSDALVTGLFDTHPFKEAAAEAGMKIYPASSFRHIAVQKGVDVTGIVLTPPHDHLGEALGPLLPRGCGNAAVLEELERLAYEILDRHPINMKRRAEGKLPANGIWFWAEGKIAELPNFTNRYGKTGGVISAVPLCQGIGMLIGLDKVSVDGATGELNTNYEGKADAVIDLLKERDFAAVHIEAPDECTHDGDVKGKLQAIEWIDSRVVGPVKNRLDKAGCDYRILIISDHKTLLSTRGHDGAPVPYIIYDSRYNKKTDAAYSEADAAKRRTIDDGTALMDLLFKS